MLPADHRSEGRYTKEDFLYDAANDRYLCPAGQTLRPRRFHQRRQMTDYVADKKICAACPLRENCTASKVGRSIARHWKEETLEFARAIARLPEAYADRARRRHLMEGSFARSANLHHFKRARWRRLWRQQIQDHLIAAVQNIAILPGAVSAGVGALTTALLLAALLAPARACRIGPPPAAARSSPFLRPDSGHYATAAAGLTHRWPTKPAPTSQRNLKSD